MPLPDVRIRFNGNNQQERAISLYLCGTLARQHRAVAVTELLVTDSLNIHRMKGVTIRTNSSGEILVTQAVSNWNRLRESDDYDEILISLICDKETSKLLSVRFPK